MSNHDIGRIKRNIAKMIDMGAPESDIDAYIREEGVTLQELQATRGVPSAQQPAASHTGGLTPRASHGGDNPDHIVEQKMATIAKRLGVSIDAPLTPSQLVAFRDAYNQTEGSTTNNVGNLRNPNGEGFQNFATRDAGIAAIDGQIRRDYNRGQTSIRSLIEGYPVGATLTPPQVLAPEPQDAPQAPRPVPAPVAPQGNAPIPSAAPAAPERTSALQAAGLGALDGISFSLDDEIGAGLATVIPHLGKKSIWDGSGLSDSFNANIDAYRGVKKAAEEEHFPSFLAGGLASAFVPFGAASKALTGGRSLIRLGKEASAANEAAKASELAGDIATASNASRFAKSAAHGAGAGAIYGFGHGEGMPQDRLESAATGAAFGSALGVAGEATLGTALRNLPHIQATRWAKKEAERNPFAAFDSEIARDINTSISGRAVSKGDPKGRAAVTAKTINSLENSYTAEFKTLLGKTGMPEADALRLKAALTSKHGIPMEDVNSLRGTVEGDAVADAITKVQRLRQLTPELARSKSAWSKLANLADMAPIPGLVGRGMRAIGKEVAGDGEAARVHAAEKLIKRRMAYEKLGEITGPSGQAESSAALWAKAEEALGAKDATAAEKEAEKFQQRLDRQELSDYRTQRRRSGRDVVDEAMTPQRNRVNSIKSIVGDFTKASDNGLSEFDARLANPDTPLVPEARITGGDMRDFRSTIKSDELDPNDIRFGNPVSERQLAAKVRSRDAAIAKLEAPSAEWEAKLADPSTAPVQEEIAVRPPSRRDLAELRRKIQDPTPDMRDATNIVPTDSALARRTQARNSALAKLETSSRDWDAALADPTTAPAAPKAPSGDPAQAAIDDAVAQGIKGISGTHDAFAGRLGISTEDMLRTLDHIEGDVPALSDEIARIRLNYPTKNKKMGPVLIPRMAKAMEELGIQPKVAEEAPVTAKAPPPVVKVDEEAQARLDAAAPSAPEGKPYQKVMSDNGSTNTPVKPVPAQAAPQELPANIDWAALAAKDAEAGWVKNQDGSFTNTKTGETDGNVLSGSVSDDTATEGEGLYHRAIRRPAQYEKSKNNRVGMASDAIYEMSKVMRPEILDALGRMPVHVRDNIKIGDDARAYFEDSVMPELLAARATPEELDAARKGFYDIAEYKPHQTQESYDAGALTRGRGRPPKKK